eukprot:4315402-Pyramimonas_sp.AAC.1
MITCAMRTNILVWHIASAPAAAAGALVNGMLATVRQIAGRAPDRPERSRWGRSPNFALVAPTDPEPRNLGAI